MSSGKRQKRTTQSYLDSAKRLAKFCPGCQKLKTRKTLKPGQKSYIARMEKKLRHVPLSLLKPVSKKTAKKFRKALFAPGVRAISFINRSPESKIHFIKDDVILESNGKDWIYWKLPDTSTQENLEDAAEDLFDQSPAELGETFDIERISALAERAFKQPHVETVHLWTKQGRVGEGFDDFKQFMRWILAEWYKYQDTERWINGISFLLVDKSKRNKPKREIRQRI